MNHETLNKALIIVDVQRTFMPTEEGERLGAEGFGELPVLGGHEIIPTLNALTKVFDLHRFQVVTTADNHLEGTAHISDNPNFVNTWPRHGLQGTPGAKLHPELIAGKGLAKQFIKGDIIAQTPEEDNSYTGALAHDENGLLLPDYLRRENITKVYVAGLTTAEGRRGASLCADTTALDLNEQGFRVTFIEDAVKPLNQDQYKTCLRNLGAVGIQVMTAEDVARDVINTPRLVR